MNIKPLTNHIFIEALKEENKSKLGIILPENAERNKPVMGKISFIGPDVVSLGVGDVVMFKKYALDEIEEDGKKYLVGDEEDIIAIIEL